MRPVTHYCHFVYHSLLILLLAGTVFTFSAKAENFSVENIHAQAIGQTATEARQRAMSEAESKAFFQLISRLSDEATATRLLETYQSNISQMVQGAQISNEKISATSYNADVILSFNPDQIQSLLSQSGVSVAEKPSLSTLVLPVFTQNDRTVLLGSANPWRDAWNNTQIGGSAVTFVLPLGDLEDISLAPLQAVHSSHYDQLKTLADKYHTQRILVADATYGQDIDTHDPVLSVVIYDMQPDNTVNSTMQFKGNAGETTSTLLARAVTALVSGLNSNWSNQGQLTMGDAEKILVKTPFASLKEWQDIQKRLNTVATIQKTSVERLAGRYAIVAVYSSGKKEDLPQYFQQSGFAFTPSDTMPVVELKAP